MLAFKLEKLKGLKLLYATDRILGLDILERILKAWDIEVLKVVDSRIVVEIIETQNYHILLTDIHMPIIDGIEITKTIRSKQGQYFKDLVIIGLGNNAVSIDLINKSGMDYSFSLPMNETSISELHQILSEIQV